MTLHNRKFAVFPPLRGKGKFYTGNAGDFGIPIGINKSVHDAPLTAVP